MVRVLLPALLMSAAWAAGPLFEVSGRIVPRGRAFVSIFRTDSPFAASTLADVTGHFRFKKLQPGTYTLAIFVRSRGEARRTVEVGPASADRKRRIALDLPLKDSDFTLAAALRQHTVSAGQLSVPQRALRDFREAQKDLSKPDVDGAVKRLEDAVERAPQFSAAWNSLGTIAYQTKKYDRAEECFRQAVATDPQSFEATVNLGGVLVTERKLDEAVEYNVKAVAARPNDALANSQLGMTYFLLGRLDLAAKYLESSRRIDPAHFSYPQLFLAEIHLRNHDWKRAADTLEDFLARHPDWERAEQIRRRIADLRARAVRQK
jgi:tetratricopeptide (TPR) repeat protein